MTGRDLDGAMPPLLAADEDRLSRLHDLRQTSALMRRVRWFAAAFVVLQFSLYHPPPGIPLPFSRWPVTAAALAAVVGVNLFSLWSRRWDSTRRLRVAGMAELAADAGIVVAVTWLFSFDITSALWALLVIPVLEGAVRAQLRGAIGTWALVSAGYLVRDLWAASRYDYAPFLPESVTYRMFIVLIVALSAGLLARNLTRIAGDLTVQVRAHRTAQRESERRAELLHIVAEAGRHMTGPDLDQALAIVVDSLTGIGFDGAAICVLDDAGQSFTVPHSSGLPPAGRNERHDADRGVVALALHRGDTVSISDALPWFALTSPVAFARTLATPVHAGDEIVAVLLGGLGMPRDVPAHVRECFELLAGQAGAAIGNARRYSERRTFQARLEHQAYHDALTGLPNRAAFLDRLGHALAPLELGEDGDGLVAVLFCDLDRFKAINDTLGHDFGDKLLEGVAARLRQCVPAEALVARLGGDEFTALLGEVADEEAAARVARRIVHAMERPLMIGDEEVHITASVGVAFGLRGRHQPVDLLRAADLAMYRAKEEGRDRYVCSPAGWDPGAVEFSLPPRQVIL